MHEQDMESFEALKPEAWGRGKRNANSNSEEGHPEWDRSRAAVQRTKSLAHFSGTYEPGTVLHSCDIIASLFAYSLAFPIIDDPRDACSDATDHLYMTARQSLVPTASIATYIATPPFVTAP